LSVPEYEQLARLGRPASPAGSANLPIVEEDQASPEVAALYQHFRQHFGRPAVPGILKCFATHPPLLRHMMALSESLLFSDGHLPRRDKEMLATFISFRNQCPYCADSHACFLRMQGGSLGLIDALRYADLASPAVTPAERTLLTFANKVNQDSQSIHRADIEALALAGWTEPQVAEAVHLVALFATFNRVANAFGLPSQGLLALYEENPPL